MSEILYTVGLDAEGMGGLQDKCQYPALNTVPYNNAKNALKAFEKTLIDFIKNDSGWTKPLKFDKNGKLINCFRQITIYIKRLKPNEQTNVLCTCTIFVNINTKILDHFKLNFTMYCPDYTMERRYLEIENGIILMEQITGNLKSFLTWNMEIIES